MKLIRLASILLLPLGAAALADDQSDRQQLIGSWELQSPRKHAGGLLDFFGLREFDAYQGTRGWQRGR